MRPCASLSSQLQTHEPMSKFIYRMWVCGGSVGAHPSRRGTAGTVSVTTPAPLESRSASGAASVTHGPAQPISSVIKVRPAAEPLVLSHPTGQVGWLEDGSGRFASWHSAEAVSNRIQRRLAVGSLLSGLPLFSG